MKSIIQSVNIGFYRSQMILLLEKVNVIIEKLINVK